MKRARDEDDDDAAVAPRSTYGAGAWAGGNPKHRYGPRPADNSGGAELDPTGLEPRVYNTTGGGAYARDGPSERAHEVDASQVDFAAGIAAGAANIDYAGGRRITTLIGGPYHGTYGPNDRGQPMGGEYIPRGPLTQGGVYGRGPVNPETGRAPLQAARSHAAYRQRYGQEPEGVQEFNRLVTNRVMAHDQAARARMQGPMNDPEHNAYAEQITGLGHDPVDRPPTVYNHPPRTPQEPYPLYPTPYLWAKAHFEANQAAHRTQRREHGMDPKVPDLRGLDPSKHFNL